MSFKRLRELFLILVVLALYVALTVSCWAQCANGRCGYRPQAIAVGARIDQSKTAFASLDVMRKTVGTVGKEARKKYDDFDSYLASRRADAVTGKGFEALYALDFNESGRDCQLVTTAQLGKPTDPADLALIDRKTGKVKSLVQCKIGLTAAIKAASDEKYKRMTILVPADVLERLKAEPDDDAAEWITSGRITASIDGFTADNRGDYEERAIDYLRAEWEGSAE